MIIICDTAHIYRVGLGVVEKDEGAKTPWTLNTKEKGAKNLL